MHIIDAIVLAKLLSTPPARRVLLHTDRCRSEEGDQRNEIDLRELAGRVRTPPDGLVGEVAQARHEAERLLKLGRSGDTRRSRSTTRPTQPCWRR